MINNFDHLELLDKYTKERNIQYVIMVLYFAISQNQNQSHDPLMKNGHLAEKILTRDICLLALIGYT